MVGSQCKPVSKHLLVVRLSGTVCRYAEPSVENTRYNGTACYLFEFSKIGLRISVSAGILVDGP